MRTLKGALGLGMAGALALIDAQRMRILTRLERRNIRVEKGPATADTRAAPVSP